MLLPRVHIEAFRHRSFHDTREAPPPESWLISYYEGLLSQFHLEMDQRQLKKGKNNDFLTMATDVMQSLNADCALNDVGLFLMAHQTLDTYFPHQSTTTRLCRKFGIEAPALALTDQELTAPYIALTVLLAALLQKGFSGSGLLLVLDQTTLPYKGSCDPEKNIDTALVMKLINAPDSKGTCIGGSHYWMEDGTDKASWIMQCIHTYLNSYHIDVANAHIVADDKLGQILAAAVRPTMLSIADARYMSCASLLSVMELTNQGYECVLLTHMADDGHLYLFSFHRCEAG